MGEKGTLTAMPSLEVSHSDESESGCPSQGKKRAPPKRASWCLVSAIVCVALILIAILTAGSRLSNACLLIWIVDLRIG